MRKFLESIAEGFFNLYGKEISSLCFVFPNRRSSIFFRKYLGQMSVTPLFCPRLLTVSDLFKELSNLREVDKIEALWRLYRRYASLMWPAEEPRESFDDFVLWGDILLGDFDDIDKYLSDARLLFANIKDINDIDAGYSYLTEDQLKAIRQFWGDFLLNPQSESKLDKKKLFRDTWSILYPLYEGFRKELLDEGKAYEGMMYRSVADSLSKDSGLKGDMLDTLRGYGKIVFVGLNALNACEKRLLSAVRDCLDGDFYWDFEGDMVRDTDNKSSMFMKDNVANYPSRHPFGASFTSSQVFRTISVPSAVGQTREVGRILEELSRENGFRSEETSVVLPDEALLAPMLNSIPECIEDVNVTMGYPFERSNVASFNTCLDHLHRNCRVKGGKCGFYHRDVASLLDHPFVKAYIRSSAETDSVDKLRKRIIKENIIFPSATLLSSCGGILEKIFRYVDDASAFPSYLKDILDDVQPYVSRLDREFIYRYETSITRLSDLHIPMRKDTWFRLLSRIISVITIPFRGEPLKGLQIMGPLETRALDFRNVIILSVNEGVFPKRNVSGSFIPYNLRTGFGLPSYELQDSIWAYYFYRSICRAENIYLLYDSRSEGLKSGESSRYIKQLKYHFDVPLIEQSVVYSLDGGESLMKNCVVKDEKVMELLERRFINGNGRFSATSLNAYITCPLLFYRRFVLGIEEEDEVSESLDSSLFGSIFHKVMENIYAPFKGRVVSREDILAIRNDKTGIIHLVEKAFLEEALIKEISGRNIIVERLIARFVDQVLKVDAIKAPFTIVGTEQRMSLEMPIREGSCKVVLFGMADRINRDSSGITSIIDYKTGSLGNKFKFSEVQQLFDGSMGERRPSIAFQLFVYTFLATSTFKGSRAEDYLPTVIALREIFNGTCAECSITTEALSQFRERIESLIDEIFEPTVPFTPALSDDACGYCEFSKLCGR